MVKVSVIIPVYNASNFLKESLDSIVNQTLSDIEIICINDGSTDNSLDILNDYKKQDNRFVIISQENQGQGVARNKGMGVVKGEYFCFFDADDKLELDALEKCYNAMIEDSLDCVMFKLINLNNENDELYTTPLYDMYVVQNTVKNNIFNYSDLGEFIFNVSVSPVNKVYNSKFIMDNNIKFSTEMIFEDHIFFWRMFFLAKKIRFLDEYLYIRRVHSKSTTGSGDGRWCDSIMVYNNVWNIFKEFDYFDKFKTNLFNNKLEFAFYRFDNIKSEYKELFFTKWKEDLLQVKENHNDFTNYLTDDNLNIYKCVIASQSFVEFEFLRELSLFLKDFEEYDVRYNEEINMLYVENYNLKKEIFKLNNLNNSLLTSKSWKLTKPFRYLKFLLKKFIDKVK